MPAAWVDFKAVRLAVRFEDVLERYGVALKAKGDQLVGFCPLPGHGGSKKSPSFSVNTKKNIFQCFGCGAKGNVLDFSVLMEGLDPADTSNLRKVALELQKAFLEAESSPPEKSRATKSAKVKPVEALPLEASASEPDTEAAEGDEVEGKPVVYNAPLDFALTTLDPNHPYLQKRGLSEDTVKTFGLGYCSRGLMKGRIAIPLQDHTGQLIGYAGRLVEDKAMGPEIPKYLLPGARERNGTLYRFSKGLFLFNAFRLLHPLRDLVVAEGFFGSMWLYQHGYPAVALMGSVCSDTQSELFVSMVHPEGRAWLMPDGDEAGKRMAHQLFELLAPYRAVRWIELTNGKQPEDCSPETLAGMFGW